jgi:SET domain-containing protein
MKTLIIPALIVKPSAIHGYGVFANKDFEENEIIEECYTILGTGEDLGLNNYYFRSKNTKKIFIPTGFGLVYNHAEIPDADYYFDELRSLLIFKSLRPIRKNEEIKIFYGKTWFSGRKMTVKKIPYWRRLIRFSVKMPLRVGLIIGFLLLINRWLHGITG